MWPKTTLLPVWPRDTKRVGTPANMESFQKHCSRADFQILSTLNSVFKIHVLVYLHNIHLFINSFLF